MLLCDASTEGNVNDTSKRSDGEDEVLTTLPSFSLHGKVCVVTCAARGLGKQFLTAFALSGAKGACVDLSLPSAQSAIEDIASEVARAYPSKKTSLTLRAYACDVSSELNVKATWKNILEDFGHVDVLVTAAGIVANSPAETNALSDWTRMMDINVNGTFLFAQQAGKHMLEEKLKGSIVLISSISSTVCVRPQKQAAYNASKGAATMLMKSLATEWGPHGIRVNSLNPGYMKTDLIAELMERQGSGVEEQWVKDIPMGRMAHPSELRGTAVWMASDASSYLNGSEIVVDGGYTCW